MQVLNDLVTSLKRTFDFSSRASRREYWTFYLFYEVVLLLTGFRNFDFSGGPFSLIIVIVLFVPYLSVGFRRMRDIGRKRWLSIIPIYGQALALIPSQEPIAPIEDESAGQGLPQQAKPNIFPLLLASFGIWFATGAVSQAFLSGLGSAGINVGSPVMNQSAQSVMSPSGINSTIGTWGISLSDSSGPRSLGDVVEDMWYYLNANASGSGDITKEDMEIALQPGNSVYNILQRLFVDQQTIDAVAARLVQLSR
jgi:hypothetical protein